MPARAAPSQIQIMYGIAGERRLTEFEVPWLSGFEGSSGSHRQRCACQLQLDVFGEVVDALYQARRGSLGSMEASWSLQCQLLKHLEGIWLGPTTVCGKCADHRSVSPTRR